MFVKMEKTRVHVIVNKESHVLPHKACLRREGLQLNRRSAEIKAGLVFAAVSDAQEVPLANQVSRCLSRDLVSDDRFWSDVLQNLQQTLNRSR